VWPFLELSARGDAALVGLGSWQETDVDVVPTPSREATLEELMERYVDGDAAAFDALYQRVSSKLLGYLLRLTRHRERAEDLLQITFTKVHRARDSYLRGAPVLPWFIAIARRTFLDERRAAAVRAEDLSRDGSLPEPRQEAHGVPNELADALEKALDSLPEAYREAIVLTKITGLSVAEAAEVLGSTPAAIKLRVHRGYNQLREQLDRFQRR
jgi:RNA polymerase sigma-70 factor (ECF subfamily)